MFKIKILYAILISQTCAVCPVHLFFLDSVTVILVCSVHQPYEISVFWGGYDNVSLGDFGTSHPGSHCIIPKKRRPQLYRYERFRKNGMKAYKLCSYSLLILLKSPATSSCPGSHTLINTHSQHVQLCMFSCYKSLFSSCMKYYEIVKDVNGRNPKRLSGFRSLFVQTFHEIPSRISPFNRLSSVVTNTYCQLPACKNTAVCSQCRPNCLLQFLKQH